jgi:ElaB/YqjD/DUF883 family membrane-anchored ribosome-binding protein
MQTEIREKTIEIRDQVGAEVKRVKEAVVDAVDNGIVAAKRAVKQGRRAAEDLVDDAEYRIKQRPFSTLGVTLGIGVGLGAAIGVLLARNGRNGNGKWSEYIPTIFVIAQSSASPLFLNNHMPRLVGAMLG